VKKDFWKVGEGHNIDFTEGTVSLELRVHQYEKKYLATPQRRKTTTIKRGKTKEKCKKTRNH